MPADSHAALRADGRGGPAVDAPLLLRAADWAIFDRPDWAIFLGLFASLWNEVAEHHSDRLDELLQAVSEPAFCDRAAALVKRLGHAVGPATVLDALGGR